MEKMNDLRDLLKHEIADLHSAEEQIINALPLMIENANNPNLKQSLERHLRITEQQLKRIEQIHNKLDGNKKQESKGLWSRLTKQKHECKGMKGIIEEGKKLIGEDMDPDVKDAAIIASCQKIEHYEICGYGTAKAYAEELKLPEIAEALSKTLNEEYEADLLLSDLAEGRINQEAEGRSASRGTRSSSSQERVRSEKYEMEMASGTRSGRGGNRSNTRSEDENSRGARSSASAKRSSSSKSKGTSSTSRTSSGSRNPRGNTSRSNSNGRSR